MYDDVHRGTPRAWIQIDRLDITSIEHQSEDEKQNVISYNISLMILKIIFKKLAILVFKILKKALLILIQNVF